MRLGRVDQVSRAAEVHRFGQLRLGIRDRSHDRRTVHDHVRLHQRDEAAHRVGIGQVAALEADPFRDSLGHDVGGHNLDATPGQRPDDVLADFARGPREQCSLHRGRRL